jgi:PAS domain S-box-containing protein
MKISVESKIVLGCAASLLALASMGWLSYVTTAKLVATENWVAHTQEVIATLESGLAILTDAETQQRGYLLTGDKRFLEDSESSQAQITAWVNKIRRLTADNPQEQQRLNKLEPLITQRLFILNRRIKLRQEQGLQAAADAVTLRQGKELMDQAWQGISEMRDAENQLHRQRQATAQAGAKTSVTIIVAAGVVAGVVGVLAILVIRRDLRLRQRAQEELDRFFTLSLDFLCIASSDGYFKRVSPAVTDILGWSVGEFLSRPFINFVHPDDRAATLREVEKQVVTGEKVLHFENRYQCKDGSWRVLSWRSTPQPGELMYATARDVTEFKQHEERIQKLNEDLQLRAGQLEAANKELEAFSYSVSHDLRAPVRHIDGFVKLLDKQAGEKLDAPAQRYLKIIADAARQMGVLIDDLLVFSRMGRTELRHSKVSLDALVHEAVDALQLETQGRRIDWKIGTLPEVAADPAMLRQVWLNLISNAIKYSQPRHPAEIEINCVPSDNGEHVFFVRDNGVGFDMKYADKLFGIFQRLHRADEFEGTGIGLANVRRIISRHGGRTWADGKIDGGATFFFSLPNNQPTTKG